MKNLTSIKVSFTSHKRNTFALHWSNGVIGNTSVFGTEESRFEP